MQQLFCDGPECGQLIQDGTERVDVTLLGRQDPVSRQMIPGARFNFHTACYAKTGPVMPLPGLSVRVDRIWAPPADTPDEPEQAAAALPDPLRAPEPV